MITSGNNAWKNVCPNGQWPHCTAHMTYHNNASTSQYALYLVLRTWRIFGYYGLFLRQLSCWAICHIESWWAILHIMLSPLVSMPPCSRLCFGGSKYELYGPYDQLLTWLKCLNVSHTSKPHIGYKFMTPHFSLIMKPFNVVIVKIASFLVKKTHG